MSDLSNFCKVMLDIIKAPEEDHPEWFSERCGLCYNSKFYDIEYNTKVNKDLIIIFDGDDYPFNGESADKYNADYLNSTMYKNPKRLAFLKEYANG